MFKRFKYTEDGFHERFRKTSPKEGENSGNYENILVIGIDRWFESAGVTKDDFKGLADLVMKEHIYKSSRAELVTFLKERDPKTTSSIVSVAEQFQTAHSSAKLSKNHNLCAMSTGFQERQSRSRSKDQDRNRHASAPNYLARGPYNNRQTFRRGSYNMSQSSFTNRPRTPNP